MSRPPHGLCAAAITARFPLPHSYIHAMAKTQTSKSSLSTSRQLLNALGVRDRIVFPFSPRKVVAALHYLADLRSSPRRVEHPLLRLNWVTAVLWLADVRHFLELGRPITGSRYQAYPEGPIPVDVLALVQGHPLWTSQLAETEYRMPYELQDDCLTRNLRIRFGYKSADYLGGSEQDALKAAVAKAKDLKLNGRDAALRGEPFQLTPLYQDIPWELLLPAKKRNEAVIGRLIASARRAVL
jgi:hypothetical protein